MWTGLDYLSKKCNVNHKCELILLAEAAKIKKGSSTPNRVNVGSITKSQLEEIANIKLPDLNTTKLSSAVKIVEGTARNMGISIVD